MSSLEEKYYVYIYTDDPDPSNFWGDMAAMPDV